MDGLSNLEGSEVKVVIVCPKIIIVEHYLHLEFVTTNNEAEYEALIIGLGITKEQGVLDLRIYSNSKPVIDHVKGDSEA